MEGDPNAGSSSSSAIKKRKKPSEVWDEMRKYMDADGNVKAECKHCKKTFDGSSKKGTTHLKNHLERCPANPKRKSGPDGRDRDDQDQSLSPSIKTKELASLIKEKSVRDMVKHFSGTEGDTSDQEWTNWCRWVLELRRDEMLQRLKSRKDEILQLYLEEKEKLCQYLNSLSCRFSLVHVDQYLLVVNYIDDSWERQSKIISCWHCPLPDSKSLMRGVKQSCLYWKIDTNVCSLLLPPHEIDLVDEEIGNMENWFNQRRSLPFAGCLIDADEVMDDLNGTLVYTDWFMDGVRSLNECVHYVHNKSTSDKLIQLGSAVKEAISKLKRGPLASGFLDYFRNALGLKEVFLQLEQLDSDFRSINLSKQKWDEVTATFEHLKFLNDVIDNFFRKKPHLPIIVDLQYVHKILTDRCDHRTEDCLFCKEVMELLIDRFFSKHYSVRVIAVILDPRLKMDGLQLHYKEIYGSDADRYLEKVKNDFRRVYDAYAATDSSSSKSYEMLDAMGRPSSPKSELDRYFNMLKVPRDKRFDILAWWRGNAPSFPTLARMARDYLAIEEPFVPKMGAVVGLMDAINCIYRFDKLPDIITLLVCLKGFLGALKISDFL